MLAQLSQALLLFGLLSEVHGNLLPNPSGKATIQPTSGFETITFIQRDVGLASGIVQSEHELAVAPGCSMLTFPVGSSCNVGINPVTKREADASPPASPASALATGPYQTPVNKAIVASCTTYYSSSSTCWAGVHLQPTYAGTTVTMTEVTTQGPTSSVATTTVTTEAQISVSPPPSTATGAAWTFFLTTDLRDKLIDTANKYCPGQKRNLRRQSSGVSCALPDGSRAELLSDVEGLISNSISPPSDAILSLLPAYFATPGRFQNLASGAAAVVIVEFLFQFRSLSTQIEALPGLVSQVASSQDTSLTGSSTQQTVGIATAQAPQIFMDMPADDDIGILTSYLDSALNTASSVTITITPNPGAPTGVQTATLTQATPVLASATCNAGGAAFRLSDVQDKVTSFCKSASQAGFTAAQTGPISAISNQFFAGQAQHAYTVPADSTSVNLYLEVKFRTEDCAPNAPQTVNFKQSGGKWCEDNFMMLVNDCDTSDPNNKPTDFWKKGGFLNKDCIEWQVGSAPQ